MIEISSPKNHARSRTWPLRIGFVPLIPAILVLIFYTVVSKEAPGEVKQKKVTDYLTLLKDPDAHWFCFYYTISFGGFVGLASSYVLYFKGEFGLAPVHGGDFAALSTFVGAFLRPSAGRLRTGLAASVRSIDSI